jgi:beta-glucosidase
VDHYKRLVDDLLANGVEPYLTLFHWDLPSALPGGWQNRDTAKAFADYAGYLAGQLSDRVKHFMTLNEVSSFVYLGYAQGEHAPGLRLPIAEVNAARHHALLAHGPGVQAIRAHAGGAQVGLAENARIGVPVIETAEHVAAAGKAMPALNNAILGPILEGAYSEDFLATPGAAAAVRDGDMAAIGAPLDLVGLNIYTGVPVRATRDRRGSPSSRCRKATRTWSSPGSSSWPRACTGACG